MNKNLALILVGLGFGCFSALGFFIKDMIDDSGYERAKIFNTAVQADEADRFNYAIDSHQGNLLGSGIFTAKEPTKHSDISGEYSQIEKVQERYTMHTQTYECGTTEHPRTCTRTYYSWDYNGNEQTKTPLIVFHNREYSSYIFDFGSTHGVGCEAILENCNGGYKYEGSGWFAGVGDLRWHYKVKDASFFGTILTNTQDGTLQPVRESLISIMDGSIAEEIKEANNLYGGLVFIVVWLIVLAVVCGFIIKYISEEL